MGGLGSTPRSAHRLLRGRKRRSGTESVRRERKGSRKKNACACKQTLAGQSAAGLLAWTSTCIWEKQAAKQGAGMGNQVRNPVETGEQQGVGSAAAQKTHFSAKLGGVRARDGTKIMKREGEGEGEQERGRI